MRRGRLGGGAQGLPLAVNVSRWRGAECRRRKRCARRLRRLGRHRDDPASVPDELELPLHPDGITGWRIALSMDLGYFEVDPEVVRNTESAAAALREAGAIVEEVTIPWTHRAFEAGAAHYCAFPGYPDPETMSPEDRALLSAPAREYQAYMLRMPKLGLEEAEAVRHAMYRDMANVFGRYRALVTPTTAVPSVPADLPIRRRHALDQRPGSRSGLGLVPHLSVQHARSPLRRERPERVLIVQSPDWTTDRRASVR